MSPTSEDDPALLTMTVDGATLVQFLQDWRFVTVIRGPWASGKSVACIAKMFQAACTQEPDRRGVRRTRWAVVRNSYPDLLQTTVRTWLDWFPEYAYGAMVRSRPFQHVIRVNGEPHNGKPTRVEMEVIFIALDDEGDTRKLLSMELTGAWVNEGREVAKPLIDAVIGRTGRYPAFRDGGPSWSGAFIDTNSPSEAHWIPMMFGEAPIPESMADDERMGLEWPDDWEYYVQPGALRPVKDDLGKIVDFEPNPDAENISNLKKPDEPREKGYLYYLQRKGGKTRSWVLVNFCNEIGTLVAGKPVWPSFDRLKHVARGRLKYDPDFQLLVGVDSTGRNPAAIFVQCVRGKWRVLREMIGRDIATPGFARQVKRMAAAIVAEAGRNYSDAAVVFYRDPHQERGQGDDRNTDQMYLQEGVRLIPAPGGNAIRTRLDAVEVLFDNDKIEIDPTCTIFIGACSGGYRFRKLKITGAEVYEEQPDKRNGSFADIADACQYAVLGGGGGREMVYGSQRMAKPRQVVSLYRPGQGRAPLRRLRASA